MINYNKAIPFPLVDETNYKGNIDIELNCDANDILALRKELQRYDLDLLEEERDIDVFVLREKRELNN